jgi:hypothetical protein
MHAPKRNPERAKSLLIAVASDRSVSLGTLTHSTNHIRNGVGEGMGSEWTSNRSSL